MKNINEVINEVKRLDPELNDDDDIFKAAVCLIASTIVGANVYKVRKFTGCTESFILRLARNWRKSGIWVRRGGGLCSQVRHSGWFDKRTGGIAFWMDVMAGLGLLERTQSDAILNNEKGKRV